VAGRARNLSGVGVPVHDRLAKRENAVIHGDIKELTLAGTGGVQEGGVDADGGQGRRVDIADASPASERLPLRGPGDARDAAHGGGDAGEGGPVRVRTGAGGGVAETAYGGVDEPGVAFVHDVVPDAEPVQHPRLGVLDERVGAVYQTQQGVAA